MSTFDLVFEFVKLNPVSSARDIIEALPHINENSVGSALDRLYTAGTIERHNNGRNWVYYVDDPMTSDESQKLTQLENTALGLEARHLWRRAATTWLEAYDQAKTHTARERYIKLRTRCLAGMTRGVTDSSGAMPGNYIGGDL